MFRLIKSLLTNYLTKNEETEIKRMHDSTLGKEIAESDSYTTIEVITTAEAIHRYGNDLVQKYIKVKHGGKLDEQISISKLLVFRNMVEFTNRDTKGELHDKSLIEELVKYPLLPKDSYVASHDPIEEPEVEVIEEPTHPSDTHIFSKSVLHKLYAEATQHLPLVGAQGDLKMLQQGGVYTWDNKRWTYVATLPSSKLERARGQLSPYYHVLKSKEL